MKRSRSRRALSRSWPRGNILAAHAALVATVVRDPRTPGCPGSRLNTRRICRALLFRTISVALAATVIVIAGCDVISTSGPRHFEPQRQIQMAWENRSDAPYEMRFAESGYLTAAVLVEPCSGGGGVSMPIGEHFTVGLAPAAAPHSELGEPVTDQTAFDGAGGRIVVTVINLNGDASVQVRDE